MIKLTNETTKIAAESLCVLLTQNDIKSFIQAPNIGGLCNILSGQSMYGYDIYVNEKDYKQAKQILDDLNLQEENTDLSQENLSIIEETNTSMKHRQIIHRLFLYINIVIFIILILIAFASSYLL